MLLEKELCSGGISGARAGSPPRMVYQADIFLSHLWKLNILTRSERTEVLPDRNLGCHNHLTSSSLPPCYQLRDADSTCGISQNTPFISSQLYLHPPLCLLKSVHIIPVAHLLSFAALPCRNPCREKIRRA